MRLRLPTTLLSKFGAIARTARGLLLVGLVLCSPALAAGHGGHGGHGGAPEIDPGAVSGAVVLLVSGTLILTNRLRGI